MVLIMMRMVRRMMLAAIVKADVEDVSHNSQQ